eukprot:CAMPEP_0182602474 /NCGR_PEP_ID=MMETSP1324-20130603/92007_1 /TAXON_ID=236786 /ORGANISM="Florenciella sp., Strain RCC1587" /LENGTH=485 /DNA_ID=CAMNT_0024820393 /DNA_START=10 /DNA_END=1467 /DNA_ORIENTATION=-
MGFTIIKAENPMKYSTKNWMYNNDQNSAILQMLLDWREKLQGREVHFTCGIGRGTHGATETTIKAPITPDGVLHTMPMLLAGPMTEAVAPCRAANLFGKQGTWEFKHERKEERNYALLDVIVDKDEEGDVGVVTGKLMAYEEAMADHRPKDHLLIPSWIKQTMPGDEFAEEVDEFYFKYHIDDFWRPEDLMHVDMTDPAVFRENLSKGFARLYSRIPEELTNIMVDMSDAYIIELLMKKCMHDHTHFLHLNTFLSFCMDMVYTACICNAINRFEIKTLAYAGDDSESEDEGEEGGSKDGSEDGDSDDEGSDDDAKSASSELTDDSTLREQKDDETEEGSKAEDNSVMSEKSETLQDKLNRLAETDVDAYNKLLRESETELAAAQGNPEALKAVDKLKKRRKKVLEIAPERDELLHYLKAPDWEAIVTLGGERTPADEKKKHSKKKRSKSQAEVDRYKPPWLKERESESERGSAAQVDGIVSEGSG